MPTTEKIRMLLLEDDEDDYRLFIRSLKTKKSCFEIVWVQRLSDALAALEEQTFEIVLTDLSLPDSSGFETVSELRKSATLAPIIVMTSLEDDSIEKEILDAGAQDYLVKGEIVGRAIVRLLQHAVQRQQAFNKVNELVNELEQSQSQLHEQAVLLRKKNFHLQKLYNTAQEFVDNVSHEFRTPLTIIKDYISLIREGMVGDINEEQQSMLDKVAVRTEDLNNMVDDLLDVSKLEAGLLSAWRKQADISDVIRRIAPALTQRAHVKNVVVDYELASDLPEAYCDSEKVARVITNLAVNSMKLAANKGTIKVWTSLAEDGKHIQIGVSDNGSQVNDSSLGRAFQRLHEVNRQSRTTVKGVGLGLSLAKELCKLNLGELTVESDLGKGNTIWFTVPVAEPLHVFRCWKGLVEDQQNQLQIMDVTIDEFSSMASANEFDNFINCTLHGDDLIFRLDERRWILAMSNPEIESAGWRNRFDSEFQKQNESRPMGPLPEYRIATHARKIADSEESLVELYAEVINSTRVPELITE